MSDSDRKAFLEAIEKEPTNYDHRYIYADWLDENGEHEEADRQRKYEKAEKWLKDFARNDDEFNWDHEYPHEAGECDPENGYWYCCGYHQLVRFLAAHEKGSIIDDSYYLGFDTPHGWNNYSEELWENFEVVTGKKAPTDQYRKELPPFYCAC